MYIYIYVYTYANAYTYTYTYNIHAYYYHLFVCKDHAGRLPRLSTTSKGISTNSKLAEGYVAMAEGVGLSARSQILQKWGGTSSTALEPVQYRFPWPLGFSRKVPDAENDLHSATLKSHRGSCNSSGGAGKLLGVITTYTSSHEVCLKTLASRRPRT